VLVLQGVGQFVGQHRLLFLDVHPVQQVHGLGLGVVVGLNLFFQKRQQKWLQRKVAVQHAELLQHDLVALHAFGAFVLVELLLHKALHRGPGGQLALHGVLDRQAGLLGGKLQQFIHETEQFARLGGGNVGLSRGLG
jgi:hypothetical protein